MKVVPEEEENVRLAASKVNEKMKLFRSQFGIDDKQDLLAMVSFDCNVKQIRQDLKEKQKSDHYISRIESLNQLIENTLSKS